MTMPYQLTPAQMAQMHDDGQSYRQIAESDGRSPDSVRGMVSRYRRGLADNATLFQRKILHPAMTLPPGKYMVCGDIHVCTTDEGFVQLMLEVAQKDIRRRVDRKLIIAGDLFNADAFKVHESDTLAHTFGDELEAARVLMNQFVKVFSEVYISMGNHDRWATKRTGMPGSLNARGLLALIGYYPSVKTSDWGYMVVRNPDGYDWRITHPKAYSINQLNVADTLAQKFQQNIISHHEHHLAIGWDRYKRYVLVNNGGLFAKSQMYYALLDDSKHANMTNGFTLLEDGYPTVYGESPFTNWDKVLGK